MHRSDSNARDLREYITIVCDARSAASYGPLCKCTWCVRDACGIWYGPAQLRAPLFMESAA